MNYNLLLTVSCFWSLIVVAPSVAAGAKAKNSKDHKKCRLWLAPSYLSTEQHPEYGLYAGEDGFNMNEILPIYDVTIPLYDFLQSPVAHRSDENRAVVSFLERNMWLSEYVGSKLESNSSTSAFIPGMGVLASYHTGYSNIKWYQHSVVGREQDTFFQSIEGKAHPARGVITPYYNVTVQATDTIKPGMELFIDYDEHEADYEKDNYQEKFTRWDYEKADKVFNKIMTFFDKFDNKIKDDKFKNDILDFMLDTILDGIDYKQAKIIRALIPHRYDKLHKVKEAGGTFLYRFNDMIKSIDWLQEHGLCVDTIRSDISTIPDAGRGAFATQNFNVGDTVTPVPMLPLLNAQILELYTETIEIDRGPHYPKEYILDQNKPPTGYQMLLNYCFGHTESSLLLLPTAPMVHYINHNNNEPNVILQWSKHDSIINDHDLHDVPIPSWPRLEEMVPPIIMELVAIRDINVGDEIFLDYGNDWQIAWDMYKHDWEESIKSINIDGKWPLKAIDVRKLYKTKPYPVGVQAGQVPYPIGVITACYIENVGDLPDGQPRRNVANIPISQWLGPKQYKDFTGHSLAVCDLIHRIDIDPSNGIFNYTVSTRMKQGQLLEVQNVPHYAITLIDRPYTSDIHISNTFRRPIHIQDHRFPQAWRNLRNEYVEQDDEEQEYQY